MPGQQQDKIEASKGEGLLRARWLLVGGVCTLLAAGGIGLVWSGLGGEEEQPSSAEEKEDVEFQPFSGGMAPEHEGVADGEEQEASEDEGPSFSDIEDQLPRREEADRSDGAGPRNIAEREVDGESIIRDTRGNAISRERAEERVEESLNTLDEIEDDHIRRLRRRDMLTTSRVIQPSSDGAEVAADIQISDDVRARIQEQFGTYAQSEEIEGVEAEDYRGVADREGESDEWDDEDYYGDEEWGDYYDEEWDEDHEDDAYWDDDFEE